MSKDFKQGDKVKLLRPPKSRTPLHPGQRDAAPGIIANRNGESAFLKFDQVFQVSEHTTAEIVSENSATPLISADFINHSPLKGRFKLVSAKSKTKE